MTTGALWHGPLPSGWDSAPLKAMARARSGATPDSSNEAFWCEPDDGLPWVVRAFVESEGIPLYLVPRADIGVRLVQAPTRAARRQVLSDRFDAIVQDCTTVIDGCDDPMVATAVHFVRDGLGALGGGHHASAQAIFTLVLDTLIMEFFPDREQRRKITNRKPSDEVPEIIAEMGLLNIRFSERHEYCG